MRPGTVRQSERPEKRKEFSHLNVAQTPTYCSFIAMTIPFFGAWVWVHEYSRAPLSAWRSLVSLGIPYYPIAVFDAGRMVEGPDGERGGGSRTQDTGHSLIGPHDRDQSIERQQCETPSLMARVGRSSASQMRRKWSSWRYA